MDEREQREPQPVADFQEARARLRPPASIIIQPDHRDYPLKKVSGIGSAPTFWSRFKREWHFNRETIGRDLLITGVVIAAMAGACSRLPSLP